MTLEQFLTSASIMYTLLMIAIMLAAIIIVLSERFPKTNRKTFKKYISHGK